MKRTRRLSLLTPLLFVAVVGVAPSALADDPGTDAAEEASDSQNGSQRIVVDYRGALQDADGENISGVFHLAFKVYPDAKAADALWTERQYVAVADGSYTVPLGRESELRRSAISGQRWIGVELVGEGELLRDRLRIRESQVAAKGAPAPGGELVDTSKTRDMIKKAQSSDQMAFADVAERAVTADRADVAEKAQKVGSMSADEIERLSNLAMERLGEHIADPDAHSASGGKLGSQTRVMDSIGGPGGRSYQKNCPPGYVVTGIKGGAGRVVDSLAIICKRLK